MLDLLILVTLLRRLVWLTATGAGSVGVYALVCSSIHPHPDAALLAIIALLSATGMTLALPADNRVSRD